MPRVGAAHPRVVTPSRRTARAKPAARPKPKVRAKPAPKAPTPRKVNIKA